MTMITPGKRESKISKREPDEAEKEAGTKPKPIKRKKKAKAEDQLLLPQISTKYFASCKRKIKGYDRNKKKIESVRETNRKLSNVKQNCVGTMIKIIAKPKTNAKKANTATNVKGDKIAAITMKKIQINAAQS